MPRIRRDNETNQSTKSIDTEEDYLDVDKPLPGQNYYCISFVSPEKVLEQKEFFMYYHYEQAFYKKINGIFETDLSKIIDSCEDGKVDISDIVKLKKSVIAACKEEKVTFTDFKNKFEDFRFRDEEKIGEVFDRENNFKTSVRGVKVRGVFDTKREADVRAAVLQRLDPLFDVFVGQVGYWCPWDPNPQKIDDIEYLNQDLNKLVKEYKANEVKKDQFYNEQKTQRQKEALSAEDRLKHQKGLSEMREFQEQQKQQQQEQQQQEQIQHDLSMQSFTNNIPGLINMDMLNNDIQALSGMAAETEAEPKSITQSIQIGDENAKEITIDEQKQQLDCDDPWLKRKLEEKQQQ